MPNFEAMKAKLVNILKYGVSIVIAVLCIYMVVRKVDWASFWQGLQCTRWAYVLLFVAASVAALVFRTARWKALLKPLDKEVSSIDTWDAINIGNVANVALPGAGELLRCGLVSTRKSSYEKILGTIAMERIWDVLAILVLIVVAISLKWQEFGGFLRENVFAASSSRMSMWPWLLLAVAMIAAAVWVVYHFRDRSKVCARVVDAISGVLQGFGTIRQMDHKLLFVSYTVGLWFMYIMMSYFGFKAVPALAHLGFVDALFISAVGNLASVIPVPSGMGPYHYLVMTALTGLYACSGEIGLLYAVLCHETHAILIIVLGIVSYVALTLRRKQKN